MIRSLVKDPLSYFQSYKNYFVAIYLAFLSFPASDLVFIFSSDLSWMRFATQAFITSGVLIAVLWGFVSTRLYLYPEPFSLKRILSSPVRPVFLIYALYLVPMIIGIVAGWTVPSAILTDPSNQVTYVLEGVMLPSANLGPILLGIGAVLVTAFIVYPLAVLSRLRSRFKDKEVRQALRIIASAFGAISVTLLIGMALAFLGYSIRGSTNLLSVALIVVAVRAFRKPTFLKSFLGVVPSLESSPTASHSNQTILIHGPGAEKFGPISKYIIDGVSQHNRVIYFHGSEGLSVVLDYDDFAVRPLHKFVQHLTDPRWSSPDHSLHVLMAFDSAVFRGEEPSLAKLEGKIRTLDLSESMVTFSRTVGLSHEEIAGRKLLLEFDPQGDSDQIFKSVLAESASNFERTVVFTRKGRPLYSMAIRQPAAKVFVLTSRVSYPKVENENLVLLPSYDTSLLLDALNKTIEAYAGSSFTIIFDSITHFIFTLGPERTYSLVRQALELMISDQITAIFAMNSKAHDQKTMATFENMFDLEILSELGSAVPEIRKKLTATN